MRYIGNKTKLLSFIGSVLDQMEVGEGRALDAFSGTASVGSYLKSRGFAVDTCDILSSSYAFQRAYVVANGYPSLSGLEKEEPLQQARSEEAFRGRVESRFKGQGDLFGGSPREARPLEEALVYLDTVLSPEGSFITEEFSAVRDSTDGSRMYFTKENGKRIDAIRICIQRWRDDGMITEDEFYLLLASLLEAADAVANTAGVYAAFIKSWQSNALRPLTLSLPDVLPSTTVKCRAYRGDINQIVGDLGHYDLLYLDPPYNTRQYSGYYHVPEVVAEGWFDGVPQLRGKTGLIPDEDKKSRWSTRDGCVPALEQLLERVDAAHVLLSYNNEGIIPVGEIERIFKSAGLPHTYQRVGRSHKRYRADRDREERQYTGDVTTEFLYYVRLRE